MAKDWIAEVPKVNNLRGELLWCKRTRCLSNLSGQLRCVRQRTPKHLERRQGTMNWAAKTQKQTAS